MIPILNSTAVVATDSEGLRSSTTNTSQGSEGKPFGAILSAQGAMSRSSATAGEPILDESHALAKSGNALPSGGKSLPIPLSSDLELTAEVAIALRTVAGGSASTADLMPALTTASMHEARPGTVPEATPEATLPQLLGPLVVVPEEAFDPSIINAEPVAVAPVQALELEPAPAPAPMPALGTGQSELQGPSILPVDALVRLINTATAAVGNADGRPGQAQLPAGSMPVTSSPSAEALTSDPVSYQKVVLANPEFSVVTAKTEITVDVMDTLKGVDLLPAKTAIGSASSAAQPTVVVPPSLAEASNISAAGLKSVVSAPLSTPVSDPAWNGEFASRIGVMMKNGLPEASLQLSPAELGRLDIKISTEGDQAKVLFTVQNMAAREAIEQAMPRLREMLEQGGLQLAHSEVADHSQSRQQGEDLINTFAGENTAESEEASQEMSSIPLTTASDAMVDYFV